MAGKDDVTLGIYFEKSKDAEDIAESLHSEGFVCAVGRADQADLWKVTVSGDEDSIDAVGQRILEGDPAPAKVSFPEDTSTTTFLVDMDPS